MIKITLSPLDSEVAQELAKRRGVSVMALVSNLIWEEAVIEIAGWRNEAITDYPKIRKTSKKSISTSQEAQNGAK